MARTSPVHAGYTILGGSGTGANGKRIDVWAEYRVAEQDIAGNRSRLIAYFYAALNPNYTSTTSYYTGLNSTFTVAGAAGNGVTNGSYDFTDAQNVNLLGSFDGWITHNADGAKTVSVTGSFTTASSYITGGNVSGQITLPTIARAAMPAAADVVLGSSCRVTWTPALAKHSFQLTFSLGSFRLTTGRITPGKTAAYTYTASALPLDAAKQFTGASGQMSVSLTTYDGDTVVGTFQDTFTVTVPENDLTRPRVTAELTPVCKAFPGLYVQKLSKISAAVTATDPLGAAITGYTVSAGGSPVAGTVSDYLDKHGAVTVTVTATNTRGFTGTWTGEITVTAYDSPRLHTAAAYRCLSDGTADPGGTFLRIVAGWSYSQVGESNACRLGWRYRQAAGSWSKWQYLSATDNVDTGAIEGVVLEKTQPYTVELVVEDTPGGTAPATFSIPVEQVYMHRTRDAMGLGGYAEGTDVLDVHWDIRARRRVNGLYIRSAYPVGSRIITVQTRFSVMDKKGESRQSVFLFGNDNGTLIQGVVGINDAGSVSWEGTSGVTVTADKTTGMITVSLPTVAYDKFILLSADPIEVL